MHLVAVDLTTGSMAFCVSKEKSIPAVCNIFDSIMHLQKALRSLREKSWKNNLLFVSPSIRRPTIQQFEEKLGKEHLPELFRMLLLAGPKVEHQLKANEIATEENWICKMD